MSLSRDQILSANDICREEVPVPEWGGSVHVTVMSGVERDAWERELQTLGRENFLTNLRARLAVYTIVDESGQRLFTKDDVEQLGKKSFVALTRVCDVAERLNRLSPAAMEDLKGKSEPSPGAA
jgi:hypothetical protein